MPIEIKELHIRVAVNTAPGGQPAGTPTAAAPGGSLDSEEAKGAMVAECVEQVLQILQNKQER